LKKHLNADYQGISHCDAERHSPGLANLSLESLGFCMKYLIEGAENHPELFQRI
jgi:hypothetical protein